MNLIPIAKAGFGPASVHIPGLAQSNISTGDRFNLMLEADTGILRVSDLKTQRTMLVAPGVWQWVEPAGPTVKPAAPKPTGIESPPKK